MTTSTPRRRGAYARLWLGGPYGDIVATLGAAARERSGVLVLTGDVGTGKTLVTQALIERLRAANMLVGELPFPHLDPLEFLRSVATAYGLESTFETREAFQPDFENFLRGAAADRKKVLFAIDEAQELTPELFQEIERLLPPADDTAPVDRAPFSVLLVGQLKLEAILQEPSHAAVAAQIRAHCRLRSLTDEEVAKYLAYRGPEPSPAGMRKVLRESKGVPRLIDHVAKHLMVVPAKPLPAVAPRVVSADGVKRSSRRRRSHGRLQLSRHVVTALVGGAVIVALVFGVAGYRVLQARHTAPDTETRGGTVEQAATPNPVSSPDTMRDTGRPRGIVEQAATPSRASSPNTIDEAMTPIDDTRTPIDDETLGELEPPTAIILTKPTARPPEGPYAGSGNAERPPARQPVSVSPPPAAAPVPGRQERPAPRNSAVAPAPQQPQTPGPKPTSKPSSGVTDSNPGAVIDWLLNGRVKPR